jgi:hypothetical protein
MLQVIHSVRYKLQRKTGYFGIYGYDFMIDEDMKTWLIEINVNPAITCNTDVLYAAIPPAISEGLRKKPPQNENEYASVQKFIIFFI